MIVGFTRVRLGLKNSLHCMGFSVVKIVLESF